MPTRFIHSRSLVIPSLVTLLAVQCHQVLGRAASGGCRKLCSSEGVGACASAPPASADSNATAAAVMSALHVRFIRPQKARLFLEGCRGAAHEEECAVA